MVGQGVGGDLQALGDDANRVPNTSSVTARAIRAAAFTSSQAFSPRSARRYERSRVGTWIDFPT